MRSGFVGIIGRPNVGKSTLLNSIVGKKIAITTSKPQTTRNIIQGIYNEDDTQIVFVDTPGIHKPNNKLGQTLNKQAYYSMEDTDILLWIVDSKEPYGKGDEFVVEKLKTVDKPVILVLNKIDKISREEIMNKIIEYKDLYNFSEIVPVSALKKDNIKELVKVIKNYLPDEFQYYGKDDVTNKSLEFLMAEIVREKVFELTEEEVPHSLTCVTSAVEIGKTSYTVYVDIIIDRESLKKIIIGSRGSKIKEIGIRARKDLENLLNKSVYLDLNVKTVKNWRDKDKYLQEYGFKDFES
jgi:GTP-binding protein Era